MASPLSVKHTLETVVIGQGLLTSYSSLAMFRSCEIWEEDWVVDEFCCRWFLFRQMRESFASNRGAVLSISQDNKVRSVGHLPSLVVSASK